MDRGELASFLYTAERTSPVHAALAVLLGLKGLRVSEACGANVEDLGFAHLADRGERQPARWDPARATHGPHVGFGDRRTGRGSDPSTPRRRPAGHAHRLPLGPGDRQERGLDRIHPHMVRAAFIMAALDAGVPLRDVQIAARHADPRTTTIYDRRRQNFDRHAAFAVVAFVTSG
jgi:integrase/recombinase XerD